MALITPIPNQYAKKNVAYSYTFPSGTFSGSGLTFTSFVNRLNLGRSLPSWLTFTDNGNGTGTFSGTPTQWYELEALQITVAAVDNFAVTSYCIFTIVVGDADNTGRPVWRSGNTPDHTLNNGNIVGYDTGTISAGQWVLIETDVTPTGLALTTINNARTNGGYIVWKINNTNRAAFDYLVVDPNETVALDFSAGNLSAIQTNGKAQGLRGAEIMFTNYGAVGTIQDNATQPILHKKVSSNEDAHIRWIGQPANHTPFVNCYGISVRSTNTLSRATLGFRYGLEFSYIEISGSGGDIGVHLKTDLTTTAGDRNPAQNSGSQDYNMSYLQIHDCYIHDCGGEGIYMGGGFYAGKPGSLPDRFYHDIAYGRADWNIVTNAGWDAIQLKNVVREGRIMFNYIKDTGTLLGASNAQRFGLFFADGFVGDVAYNWIENAGRSGIRGYDSGLTLVHDNLIIAAGSEGYYGAKVDNPDWNINAPIALLVNRNIPANVYSVSPNPNYTSRADLADGDLRCWIFHNTFVNCADTLKLFTDTPAGRVQNNLFVNCGRTTLDAPAAFTQTGNLILTGVTLTDIFVDPNNKDYRIKVGSAADATGVDISSVFSQKDYGNKTRVAATPGVGAFESNSTAYQDRYNYVLNPPGSGNIPPDVSVGLDVSITLPTNSVVMTATASDPDGTIASYLWTQVSGPSAATLENDTTLICTATNLGAGTYIFRCTVTDNAGGTAFDEKQITVANSNLVYFKFYRADNASGLNSTLVHTSLDGFYQMPAADGKYYRAGIILIAKTGNIVGQETFVEDWKQNV